MRRGVPLLIILAAVISIASQSAAVFASVNYGDTTIEVKPITVASQYVQALTIITVNQPTVMQSVSLYLQYDGSDGSQCIKFGIYADNGNGSPLGQPLVAATKNGYCLQAYTGTWGPAWETWKLDPSDYLTIGSPGTYWLSELANQAYGTMYHYTYTGAYGGQYYYSNGYNSYSFPASYALGFPPSAPFGISTTYPSYVIINGGYDTQPYGPFSFYMTGS